ARRMLFLLIIIIITTKYFVVSGVYCSLPYSLSISPFTCDGFVQRLSCGKIVQSATYGRTSSQICSIGRPPSETSNTQCSIDVPAVFKRCNGLRECELNTQGLAPKDPCFGTYKYYTTNYICIPAGLDFFYLFLQFQFFIISFSV
uniref:SUEL-type lectin domain-containing protein n=1 Tax=Sinocyclocheilus anshuiensis TaxID=1608454 RepID=A0A671S702_9TELE